MLKQPTVIITKKCPKEKLFQTPLFYFQKTNYLLALASLTVNLFLPFALLAAKTLLPLGVDILSLNPCLFLLFLSDGWNVLFILYTFSCKR